MNKYSIVVDYDYEDDVTTIKVLNKDNKSIGYIIYEKLYKPMEYELKDFVTEEEFDNIYKEPDNIIMISYLVVNPAYRNKGIGSLLMNKILEYTKKEGYSEYYLNASPMDINVSLEDLISFYSKFGFKVFKHQGNNALMYRI